MASLNLAQESPSSPTLADDGTIGDTDEKLTEYVDVVRYFLLCPTRHIQHAELFSLVRQCPPFNAKNAHAPRLFYVTVPTLAPISAEQAAQWSEQYWPISYKNTNPYGPHPSLVQRNTMEIEGEAGSWLALAKTAGQDMSHQGLGEPFGVVVVDRTNAVPEIIAVAGDCRWRSPTGTASPQTGPSNVMAHAAARAIAMVAKKRLRAAGTDPTLLDRSLFCDTPLSPTEQMYYDRNNIASSGYLCVDLDIYLTNEPCVMCSMAILHSRFRRCVFTKRMPLTGGMTSDVAEGTVTSGGLQHGLFWRPSELNWKFLAWEFSEEKESQNDASHLHSMVHV